MADIFAEVDEAMRRERLEKLWKKHGKLILGVLAVLIVATGIRSAFDHWNDSVRASQTSELIALMADASFPDNIKDSGPDLRPGLRGVALLTGAGALMDAGKSEEAFALYGRAAKDTAIPDDLRHLAVLMMVRNDAIKEGAVTADLLAQLKPVWNSSSPWRWHARLEAAALLADRDHDYAAARKHLQVIAKGEGLPDTLYAKAKALDHVYATREQEEKTKKESNES